jgi:hypothetical protein
MTDTRNICSTRKMNDGSAAFPSKATDPTELLTTVCSGVAQVKTLAAALRRLGMVLGNLCQHSRCRVLLPKHCGIREEFSWKKELEFGHSEAQIITSRSIWEQQHRRHILSGGITPPTRQPLTRPSGRGVLQPKRRSDPLIPTASSAQTRSLT